MKSLYIHIPFCKQKCYYCDFNSYAGKENLVEKYVEAVEKELFSLQKDKTDKFNTVYFGGGTPSVIPSKYILQIMQSIKCDGEVTLELNPGTITREKLQDYKKAGINRLSIGLQTTNDALLKNIGRIHTLTDFDEAFNMAREEGFNNISVDLMIGLSNQTLEDVKNALNHVIKLNPEHISVYSLIVHDELVEAHKQAFSCLPSDEEERKMYYLVCEELTKAGFEQYEISNFAKPGYASKHNLCYWNQDEYYGVGAGASSYIDGVRYKNVDGIEEYISKIQNNDKSVAIIEEKQTKESKIREYMILKLRLIKGVSANEAKERFKIDIFEFFGKEISKLINLELLEKATVEGDTRLSLTKKGLDLANIVWEEFV